MVVLGAIGSAIEIDGEFKSAPMSKMGVNMYGVAAAAPVVGLQGLVVRGMRTVTLVTFGDPVVSMHILVASSPLTSGGSPSPHVNFPQNARLFALCISVGLIA